MFGFIGWILSFKKIKQQTSANFYNLLEDFTFISWYKDFITNWNTWLDIDIDIDWSNPGYRKKSDRGTSSVLFHDYNHEQGNNNILRSSSFRGFVRYGPLVKYTVRPLFFYWIWGLTFINLVIFIDNCKTLE